MNISYAQVVRAYPLFDLVEGSCLDQSCVKLLDFGERHSLSAQGLRADSGTHQSARAALQSLGEAPAWNRPCRRGQCGNGALGGG